MAAVEQMQHRVAPPGLHRLAMAPLKLAVQAELLGVVLHGLPWLRGAAPASGSQVRDRRAIAALPAGRPPSSACSHGGHRRRRGVKEKNVEFF
jgi:hypothetical protein